MLAHKQKSISSLGSEKEPGIHTGRRRCHTVPIHIVCNPNICQNFWFDVSFIFFSLGDHPKNALKRLSCIVFRGEIILSQSRKFDATFMEDLHIGRIEHIPRYEVLDINRSQRGVREQL